MKGDIHFLHDYLREFRLPREDGQVILTSDLKTSCDLLTVEGREYPRYTNEFWTARQRQASRLHEISYRACFKPQLPRFFISLLTDPGDIVYDPFTGRGTTPIEAALMGRNIIANDINPLSRILTEARLCPPDISDIRARLYSPEDLPGECEIDLSMFYHPDTLKTICSLRAYLHKRQTEGTTDDTDRWIRMIATNRLTGHSPGFFSVYTLPPNQAVTPDRQIKINRQRNQVPPYRDVREIILKKTRSLLQDLDQKQQDNLADAARNAVFLSRDARDTGCISDSSVQLTVTSPPFLDIVQYSTDNWLRCWFNHIDAEEIARTITMSRRLADWEKIMASVFSELFRITKPGGFVAFEVGEIRNGSLRLDEHVIPLGTRAGFTCITVVINRQDFTKTANIWGVGNMKTGTNTNRIVIFTKKGGDSGELPVPAGGIMPHCITGVPSGNQTQKALLSPLHHMQ
ncbi:MAG: site-specific DNA-methyltransferase [Methanospirillum sp.]|nr:site-specific DNA-methyltransferase [Methanospirillum sp.]